MASRIRGITIEIGGDTTKLESALKGVNSAIRDTQSQLRDVERLLKLDPGNTELLAQRQRLLGDAVRETGEKLETLTEAARQAGEALKEGSVTQEQYDALQREIVQTREQLRELETQALSSAAALQEIAAKGEKLKTVGGHVTEAGRTLLPLSATVIGLGTAAVKTAADFDSSMSRVAALSGACGGELEALREKARRMGESTKFSATEAAQAMAYMSMAGWSAGDMLGGLEGVMYLAAASGEELSVTADIVTDALTAFGMRAEDSARFADILAAASANANTNVSMMGETFRYCAPVAGALGFSAEDTALAIGLAANAGIKGSQAGTALRGIMSRLSKEVRVCGAELGEVTIATTGADGSMRELSDILADCRDAFGALTEAEQAQAAESLVGKGAMSAFLALMNAGEGDVRQLTEAIASCDGVALDMSRTMQDNLAGRMEQLRSQLGELAISFGELLMPVIETAIGWIRDFIAWLNSMDDDMRSLIITVGLVLAVAGPILILIGKVITAVGTVLTLLPKMAAGVQAAQGAMAAFNAVCAANPIMLVVMAIAALVAAFIYLWNNCEEFRRFWIDLWDGLVRAVSGGLEKVTKFLTGLAGEAFGWGRDFIGGLIDGILSMIGKVGEAVSAVAGKIRSFLHFSVPDEGPLTDYESWMPDFVRGLARGLAQGRGMLRRAAEDVAGELMLFPPSAPGAVRAASAAAPAEGRSPGGGLFDGSGEGGDLVIPVYIGSELIDEVVITAQQRHNMRSGGR